MLVVAGSAWSSVSSFYFERGRLRGRAEAASEIVNGVGHHFERGGRKIPAAVPRYLKTAKLVDSVFAKPSEACGSELWLLGEAIGMDCWNAGQAAALKKTMPAQDVLRIDLPLIEALHLAHLAHFGFQQMMPNYRSFEICRFSGEQDACEAALAVEQLEAAIFLKHRSFGNSETQCEGRHALISNWWRPNEQRRTA
ncbi:hypothetical protein [Rhodopseudomonas palustris]